MVIFYRFVKYLFAMEKGWKFKKEKTNLIVGTEAKPTQFKSGEVIINKKSTKKHLDKLIQINNDGINKEPKGKVTNDATEGGLLKGKPHYDENGNPTGGIPGIVDGVKKIETEGDEFVINAEASRKHWQELSKINQEDGNGVAIGPQDANYEEDPEEEYKGGGKIEFNANHIPSKWVMSYAKKIKSKYPEIWKLGGNIFGNQAFENLERVFNRGYWLDSEKWMYIKWRSYVARHQRDYHIGGVVAMLKWVDKVEKGWPYMKELIEDKIAKKGWKHKQSSKKMKDGGNVITYKDKYNTKYGYKKGESHSLEQIHIDSGVSMNGLQQIYDKGIGAYKTNPQSVRPNVKSKEQWAMARVYSSVMGGKAAKIDAKELKMVKGGGVGQEITCVKCAWHWNTNQSEEFDKYVCHNCGTDNSMIYAPKKHEEGGKVNEKKIRVKVEYLEEQFYELNKEIDVPVSVFKQYQKTGKVPREFLNDLTSEIEDKNWVETNPMSVHLTIVEKMSKGGTLMVKGNLVKVGDTGIYNGRVKEDITVTSISPKIVTFVTSNGVKKGVYTYKFEKFYIPSNVEKPIEETIEQVKVENDKEDLNKKFDLLNKKYVKYSKLLDQKTKANENTDDIEEILDVIQEEMSKISNKIEESQLIEEPIIDQPKIGKKSYYVFYNDDTKLYELINNTNPVDQPIVKTFKREADANNYLSNLYEGKTSQVKGKMAYEMTLDEYQAKVSPIIKDYRKFIKKYEKWFAASAYNGLLYVSLEEVIDALNSGISYSNFRLPSKDDWTYRNFTPEQQARYEYSYRKTRKFDENYTQEPTPQYLIDEKNNYINKFKEFFTKDEIESRVEQDELKSNKRSVRRAIDNGTYAKMLESGEITIERLNEIGDSVGVRIPRSVLSPKDRLKAEFDEKKRKALSELPTISVEKMDALIQSIFEDLKPLESEIYIKERKRILELFSKVTKLQEISVKDLAQMNLPQINIYIITTVRVIEEDRRIKDKFVKVELNDNWEKELNKALVEFVEALKYKIIFSIINNFDRITVPISEIKRLSIKAGNKGFEGQYKFMFENGCSFVFETQSIPAGGYNIQAFHYRFLSNFVDVKSPTGERIPNNEFYKYFNAENYSKLEKEFDQGGNVDSIEKANIKIDQLPNGKLFDDAKNIQGIFDRSKYSWSEVIENFEKNKNSATLESINIKDIHITQPNIQSNKVKSIIKNIDDVPVINVIQFKNGEKAIYDGHHRLVANWALGNNMIKVNLVKVNDYFNKGGSIDQKDTVTLDIPLLIRTLELAREDIKSDEELHRMVERLLNLKNKKELTMDDYEYIAKIQKLKK